ncbi:D-2-hydroxyacid dehydrogenase family protein [Verticiella sediminum]|uniref:D-2-hydroxyacid dehydrogenase family protein n=1 Tax=Verticiella sediminum TaxID=1247510 RepID=A0A556APQ5_9BURK|nr:D-2-hydroxyacid dehydrogenase family protein [Verticiella sediminum]TSH94853.1 D-2-hydroxyacid dehydrogenase family protein [Verticiella sediminum]
MHIAVLDDYQDAARRAADWSRIPGASLQCFHDSLADTDALTARLQPFEVIVAMRERTRFDAALLARLPQLKLLVTTGMRNAAIDLETCARRGIIVCGTGSNPLLAAEQAWAMILGLYKDTASNDAALRQGTWQPSVGRTVAGNTLGVVGLGKLGAAVARYGKAFGMRVLAWSPNITAERCAEQGVELADKATLFAQSDVVSLHLVLGPATRHIVGATELRWMKPDAFLVNTSRGALLDEAALCEALAEGRIAGAALDVYEREPLPREAAILRAPRTLLSPHVGYVSRENYRQYYTDAVEDILAWRRGEPIRTLV